MAQENSDRHRISPEKARRYPGRNNRAKENGVRSIVVSSE